MKIKPYILLLLLFFLSLVNVRRVQAGSEESQETQVKAAFVYNFIKFVDWPKEKEVENNEPITIGIIGSGDFIKAFDPIKNKKIKDRNISIKYFPDYEKLKKSNDSYDSQWDTKIEALKVCHVLMFCNCDAVTIRNPNQIIKALEGLPILTIGESEKFLEAGGIINFLMEGNKVNFEVNSTAAKVNKLKISSNLLRLAKRVIEEK